MVEGTAPAPESHLGMWGLPSHQHACAFVYITYSLWYQTTNSSCVNLLNTWGV